MRFRPCRLPALLALALLPGCKGSTEPQPEPHFTGPYDTPLPASLVVGDLVRLNVNGEGNGCLNPVIHVARVEAIGEKSMILSDTLNPKNGFTAADYQRYAAKFDTLVYPIDEGAFGAPTDIDNNGRVGIIFTRTVNELTPPNSNQYVGGFTHSRDLFPRVATPRAEACPASNQGEYFYALAPDPQGTINNNVRTTAFVDAATVPVLAHELQHLINSSRKLYVNTSATAFEETWLDEGLAHIAEELLFYRESGLAPRSNITLATLQSRSANITAFNADMIGNAGRYKSYLLAPSSSSPYRSGDSLATRGAAWNWLRYMADQKLTSVTRNPGAAIELSGPGAVSAPGGTAGAEYYATLVNSSTSQDVNTSYGLTASAVIPPSPSLSPVAGLTLSRAVTELGGYAESGGAALQRDVAFESRLRHNERALAPTRLAGARSWYDHDNDHIEVPQGGRYSSAPVPIPSPDSDIWFRLVNNTLTGIANVQQVLGVDARLAVSDWSSSHSVDDVTALPAEQFLQKSWNWRSVYSGLGGFPLSVTTMVAGTPYSGTILSGGSAHYRFAVPAGGSATLTVTSSSGTAAGLRLMVVRTK